VIKGDAYMKKIIKSAFLATIPVMLGYLSVGMAFGLLFEKSGYNFLGNFWERKKCI